ncbi:autotransporter assembly complex protein TamA [Microbulbifer agarilyticus]|uniref:autotransporter assembly complex protein TamA n=1 Tax=Microbulbifer agarilyticus TaxID=260552 RepID=UPI001CD2FC75|nr:BamA/TamA family outer membrane protein [Microbulbifer agarilyticus]MCA0895051.1 BamA/TamA family outer membrane protein [Microbulbifer agarilyticus]
MRDSLPARGAAFLRYISVVLLSVLFLLPHPTAALPFFDRLPKFKVRVLENAELQEWLKDQLNEQRKSSSVLKSYDDPQDVARYERGTLEKLLRSRGYYDGRVRQTVDNGEILYRVVPGQVFRIKSLEIDMPPRLKPGFPGVGLQVGDPLEAVKVTEGVKKIETYLAENACLLELDVDYKATVIHSEHAARLEYRVAPSPEVRIGQLYVEGVTSINEPYLRKRLQLSTGDCFNRAKLDAAKLRLLRTNLIAGVNTEVSEPYDGGVDITFLLTERKHRTVRLGVGYTSDEGAGVSAGWEHRNILGRGEKIEVETRVNEVKQSIKTEILVPRFFRDDQNFSAKAEASNEERDSYDAESVTIGGTISRRHTKHRTFSIGSELKFSEVQEEGEESENYNLLSFPLGLKIDTTDNLLDARRGATVAFEVKPYFDLRNSGTRFVKNTLVATGYLTGDDVRFDPTLALRIKAGVINGIDNLEIPADERFYAGGGGSVRGYSYQALGPRRLIPSTVAGEPPTLSDPIGGRALSEVSLEGRFRFTESWGGVLFVDGGNAYEDPQPSFDDLYWGVGLGVRYMTSFAPLRFDIAFPLDRRDGLDDSSYQIYVSLGQAF